SSTIGAGGTYERIDTFGADGRRGRSLRDGLARPARPRRCTLPITALRVTPPRARAIWLAESPSVQRFLSCSTRSSVQLSCVILGSPQASATRYRINRIETHKGYAWDTTCCPHDSTAFIPSRQVRL